MRRCDTRGVLSHAVSMVLACSAVLSACGPRCNGRAACRSSTGDHCAAAPCSAAHSSGVLGATPANVQPIVSAAPLRLVNTAKIWKSGSNSNASPPNTYTYKFMYKYK